MINIKHSFNCGDAISILPGLKQIYSDLGERINLYQRLNLPSYYYDNQINSTVDANGTGVCMNEQLFHMLKPLLEAQNYIANFQIWKGQPVDLDYDVTRDMKSIPMPAGLIHTWGEAAFPQTATDLSKAWISVENSIVGLEGKVIINRTQRYFNPYITYFFLKGYEDKILFSGTETEYTHFCKEWHLNIEHLKVKDFFELAQVINGCKFGIYNQSFNFHLADAMKTKRILELCTQFPNTFVTGANGYQFYRQQALEFYFNKLINE